MSHPLSLLLKKAAGMHRRPFAFYASLKRYLSVLLLGFFRSVLSLLGRVGSSSGRVGSGVGSSGGRSSSSVGSGGGSSVSSLSGGVSGSLGGIGRGSAGSGGSVGSSLGFGSRGGSVGRGVSSLLFVRAGGQGQAQGQRDQRLVDGHLHFLVVIDGNALLRAGDMMTIRIRLSSGCAVIFVKRSLSVSCKAFTAARWRWRWPLRHRCTATRCRVCHRACARHGPGSPPNALRKRQWGGQGRWRPR